jgi:hypothetical protein
MVLVACVGALVANYQKFRNEDTRQLSLFEGLSLGTDNLSSLSAGLLAVLAASPDVDAPRKHGPRAIQRRPALGSPGYLARDDVPMWLRDR